MAINVIKKPAPPPGTLGKAELYALAIGQVIGAGVITLIVPAIKMTGYSAWLAYVCAIIMGFFIVLPTIFVSSTLRMGGGYYSMLADMAGPRVAGMYAFAYLTQSVSLSLFGTAAAAYIGDIVPALSGSTAKIAVGGALLTFFYIVNLFGIDMMAKLQKVMTWFLIGALVLFAIIGSFNINLPIFDFSSPDFIPYGMLNFSEEGLISSGFIAAVFLFVYSCQGYYMTMAYGKDAKAATRDIPFAMMIAMPTLLVLYVGVAIAAVGSTSLAEFGDSTTLVTAAQNLLPGPLFYVFIIGGPIMALLSTLNSSFAYSSITIGQSCIDGWLPKKFGDLNKYGSRKYILTFIYLMGMTPILLGFNISTITNQIQLLGAAFGFMYFFGYIQLPKKYPEQWAKSRYHVPDPVYYFFVILTLVLVAVLFWKSCLSIAPSIVYASVGALVLCVVLSLIRPKFSNINIQTSVWTDDEAVD